MTPLFFDRDISWLSFNDRVLDEAGRATVPLMERLRFLSIYSSNLDEFYRVRIPALTAINSFSKAKGQLPIDPLQEINNIIHEQQEKFGNILSHDILPGLSKLGINVLFNAPLPSSISDEVREYFFNHVAGYLCLIELNDELDFFPENNKLYLFATLHPTEESEERYVIINIPSDHLSRFYTISKQGIQYILFLDDIIRYNLSELFPDYTCVSAFSFKVTRDAELDIKDEYEGNLALKIEKEISKRDLGLATRFLFQSGMPSHTLVTLSQHLGLQQASIVEGGVYHNLKDLASLPLAGRLGYEPWPKAKLNALQQGTLLDFLRRQEIILHPPYHSYDTVIRFFNEASIDPHVTSIYITLYRVASDSRIANALCHAARNGKKVTVFIELKARFDEANNIRWAKKMRDAGVRIISSIPELKVHAKLALVKRVIKSADSREYFGVLSTGNFNESTARFYTDHVLLTSNETLLREAEQLFRFLRKRRSPVSPTELNFTHLLVAQFNLQKRFLQLIDHEIEIARKGLAAEITIKLNNLEEQVMISKLYEASKAGVKIQLIVRGICCLVPGVEGMSENIRVVRIIDRFLEHGRVFVFHHGGEELTFLGSADWMNRNIYRRIEVCFPVLDPNMKQEIRQMLTLQLNDNQQAVMIDMHGKNIPVEPEDGTPQVQSQKAINTMLNSVV